MGSIVAGTMTIERPLIVPATIVTTLSGSFCPTILISDLPPPGCIWLIVDVERHADHGAADWRPPLGATIIGGPRKIVGIIVTREAPPNPRPVAIAPAGIARGRVGGACLTLGRTLVRMVDAIVAATMIGA